MALVFPQAEVTGNIGGTGLSSRRPVRTATVAAGTLATSFADGQTIDGVTLATNDRVLIKNQASGVQNGVYIVQASGAPVRATDYDDGDAVASSIVYAQVGGVNANTGWLCTNTSGSDVIGIDALTFKLISGDVSGGASTDNAIVRWDGTSGIKIQNSGVLIDDSNNMTGLGYAQFSDIAAPVNPSAGQGRLYKRAGDDGIWWRPDAVGPEVDLTDIGLTSPLTTKGDIWGYSTLDARLPVGANNYLLAADSGHALGLRWAQSITPAQLPFAVVTATVAADVNDYNPAGLSTAVQLRLTPTGASRSITGLTISGSSGAPNLSELKITNVGTQFNIILRSESASSLAANRFTFDGQDVVIMPGQNCTVWYDWTTTRWRGVSMSQDGRFGGQYVTAGVITPTSIGASQNDYNPTGLENAAVLRLTATAVISITGLAGGYEGRRISLVNIGSLPITIPNLSVSSLAANRFYTGTSAITLVGNNVMTVIYDGTSGYWRVSGGTGGATSGAGGLLQSQWVEVTTDLTTTGTDWPVYYSKINAAGVLPTGTITVLATGAIASTPVLPGSPAANVATVSNPQTLIVQSTTNNAQIVSYTGTTGTTFTGCTGGIGAIAVGNFVFNGPVQTSIAAGSNGVALPTGTINVVATAGFPAAGTLLVSTSNGTQKVTYAGTTATTFTGCTGGTGTMSTGGLIYNVSATTQDFLTTTMTTSGGAMIIIMSASASTASNRTGYFHVVVDGFVRRGGSTQGNGGVPSGSSVVSLKLSNVAAGDHVITTRWVVEGGNFDIRPVTFANDNNASLLVQEVSS